MDTNIIDSAVNKKYTEFSAAVKKELQNKLANHEISRKYANEYDQVQHMKQMFAQINNSAEE